MEPQFAGSMSGLLRRLRRVAVTPELFIDAMKHGMSSVTVVENALPGDAQYVGAAFDPSSLCVWLFVSSATFDLVGEGDAVPLHPSPMFRRVQ